MEALASGSPSLPAWAYILGALGIGGILTAVFTYLGARRTTSGRIDTTEAAKLWDESNSMRQELRNEVVSLRAQVDQQAGKIELLMQQNEECRQRVDELTLIVERRRAPTARKRT